MATAYEESIKTIRVDHPGETSVSPPDMPGYRCVFVGRKAGVYTTFTYRKIEEDA